MQYKWEFNSADIERVKAFAAASSQNPLVIARSARNLAASKSPIERERFWAVLVACLMTTQQKSGPTSAVTRFLCLDPFPLSLIACESCNNILLMAQKALEDFGGIRFTNRIPQWLKDNLPLLARDSWNDCFSELEVLRLNQGIEAERRVADFVEDHFSGCGPKQSRNVLQLLGLTRYEIPLDSRIMKWMRKAGFPVPLNPSLLSDREYYVFVEDAFQQLCNAAEVFPCVLDAAIFASFDGDGWTEELAMW